MNIKQDYKGSGDNIGRDKITNNITNIIQSGDKKEEAIPFDFATAKRTAIDKKMFQKYFVKGQFERIFDSFEANSQTIGLTKQVLNLKRCWKANEDGILKKKLTKGAYDVEHEAISEILLDWIMDW